MAGKSRSESGEAAKDETEEELPISTSAAAEASARRLLQELSNDVLIEILQRTDIEVIVRAGSVCKSLNKACRNPDLWCVLDLDKDKYKKEGNEAEMVEGRPKEDVRFERICECAVDRSQGQLIDLRMANHGEYNLLSYIANRSRRLRRLKLHDYDIGGPALTEALRKLPELEELHLMMMWSIHAKDIEDIGKSCPRLKSFTYNNHWEADYEDPKPTKAFAVAKTMRNLRHLSLFGDCMENEGLKAILDGCPHLESLDLRQCLGLDLKGDLGKRLREGIKVVRLPEDSISDIEWTIGPSDSEGTSGE